MQQPGAGGHGKPGAGRYVVFVGRNPGIYMTWGECQRETSGFSGAVFEKFGTCEEAYSQWMRYWAKESLRTSPRFGAAPIYRSTPLYSATATAAASTTGPLLNEASTMDPLLNEGSSMDPLLNQAVNVASICKPSKETNHRATLTKSAPNTLWVMLSSVVLGVVLGVLMTLYGYGMK